MLLVRTGGNQWSSRKAPSPPPGTRHINRNSEGGGGSSKALTTGVIVAVASIGGLVFIAGLIALFSRRKNSHHSSHFFDEEKGGTNRSKPLFTPQSSQMLQFDSMDEFKGQKTVDSNTSIETKPSVKRTSSVSFKNSPTFHLIPSTQADRFSSPEASPDTRGLKAFVLTDLQNSASGFSPNRLIGEGTIGRVYKAKFQDGKVCFPSFTSLLSFFILLKKLPLYLFLVVLLSTEICSQRDRFFPLRKRKSGRVFTHSVEYFEYSPPEYGRTCGLLFRRGKEYASL